MPSILIVEDDTTFLKILKSFLEKNDFRVVAVGSAKKAYQEISKLDFDLILTDYRLPDEDGLEILKWVKQKCPTQRVMIMTRYSDVKTAISSMKLGALDYIVKPVNPDILLTTINEVLKQGAEHKTGSTNNIPNDNARWFTVLNTEFVRGKSRSAIELHEKIRIVGPTDMSVIIYGESGTGKEHVARLVHQSSNRSEGPFVAVDCGAIPREIALSELFGHVKGAFTGAVVNKTGQLEVANHGTIFLDEIGNLSYDIQVQLLRALQERKIKKVGDTRDLSIDVRFICATNEDLKSAMQKGAFREDLYHRLNEFDISVSPLRDRHDDIDEFADYFLKISNKELNKHVEKIDEEVKWILKKYSWPGNIREFKNIIKRGVLLAKSNSLTLDCLPEELVFETKKPNQNLADHNNDLKAMNYENEKALIERTLLANKYNKSKTAKILNIDRKTLYLKIEKYNIDI